MARNNIKKYAKDLGISTDNASLGRLFELESWRVEGIVKGSIEPDLSQARYIAKKLNRKLEEVFPE